MNNERYVINFLYICIFELKIYNMKNFILKLISAMLCYAAEIRDLIVSGISELAMKIPRVLRSIGPTSIARMTTAILLFVMMLFAHTSYGQVDMTSPATLFNSIDWLFGVLVLAGGYAAPFIPFVKNIDKGVYRVLAVAVILGIGFWKFGHVDIVPLLITYASTTSLYEVILKLIIPSKKNTG